MIRRSVATAVSALAGVLLGVLACCGTARGAVIVEATVTPDAGFYHFDLLITNSGPDDVVLVTLMDAPLADPLIGPSLIVAVGFLGNYDPGLGFVDFLEDTDLFAVGTVKGPFSFDSLTAPGADSFSQFQALTTNGDQLIGCVIINGSCIGSVPVPEPASWLLLVLGLGCILIAPVRRRRDSVCLSVVLVAGAMLAPSASFASSHSDAPLIKQDPQANLTDVYAFIGTKYDDPGQKVLNVIVSVRPFSEPGDGVMYERFADDVLYSIHITNPVTGVTLERYDYRFSSITGPLKNSGTILSYGLGTELGPITSIGDARQNFTQTYSVYRNGILLAGGLPIPPPNVGARTTPAYNDSTTGKAISGATSLGELDSLTAQGIRTLATGAVVWAGPREDGFYADTSGTFDLLDPRIVADKDGNPGTGGLGQDGGGVDSFKGFNVLSYALQIPVASLPASSYTDPLTGQAATGVGVYASVSRPRTTLRRTNGRPVDSGPWIQVNRLGNPLFNEVFVALRDKDAYNRTPPSSDAALATYALNPELGRLINTVLFGDPTGAGPLPVSGRTDLAAIFIPDVVRVNTSTPPVRLPGQAGFSRLGFRGGDLADASGTSGGWPNGRRIGDDVIDIALSALSRFTVDIGDNVNANDQLFHRVFPYLGTPHSGPVVDQRQAP